MSRRRRSRLTLEQRGRVAAIRIDGGAGLDEELAVALCDAVQDIEADDGVWVTTLRGSGEDFCSGAAEPAEWLASFDCVAAVGRMTKPIVALIEGTARAEGCELALACDLRLASTRARFELPQLGEGRLPRCGATQRLPRLVGRMRALDLLLSGRVLAAREAGQIGLVAQVLAPRQAGAALHRCAAGLAAKGPLALRYAKEAVVKGAEMSFEQGLRLEEDLYVLLQTTADRREGIDAFLTRRQPRFVGS